MHRVWKMRHTFSFKYMRFLFNVQVLIQLYVVPICSNPCDSCMLSHMSCVNSNPCDSCMLSHMSCVNLNPCDSRMLSHMSCVNSNPCDSRMLSHMSCVNSNPCGQCCLNARSHWAVPVGPTNIGAPC